MGISGDFKSIVSRRSIRLRESTLPLTTDSCSGRAGFYDAYFLHTNIKYIHLSWCIDLLQLLQLLQFFLRLFYTWIYNYIIYIL